MADLTSGNDPTSGHQPARRDGAARRRDDGARLGMDYTPPPRATAFIAAGRHTARVKFLRRAIIVGTVLLSSIIGIVVLFNPFSHLPGSMSLAGVGIKGTKITMDAPKISGVQQGGGTYEIKAKAGIQDITKPSVVELVDVNARVGMADRTTTRILARSGIYDNKVDTMTLSGDVRIANTSGYVLTMKSALMSFREGVFSSNERLTVDLKGGSVSADDMRISNNGHAIAFHGHIASTFDVGDDEPEGAPASAALAVSAPAPPVGSQ